MKSFDQWMADQALADEPEVWLECHCGTREMVKIAALRDGDSRWYTTDDLDTLKDGDVVRGTCCGNPRCMP